MKKHHWEVKKLGEVCELQNGFAFDSKKFSQYHGVPLVRIRDLKNGKITEIRYSGDYDKKYEIRSGDFLIGMDGEFRCYEWKGPLSLLNQRVCRLKNFKGINPRFLFYGINQYLKEIENHTTYTTVKHISSKKIESIEIPLPPLPEQQRIVKKLDQVFFVIDQIKERVGRNLKNAKEVFEAELKKIFLNPLDDWEVKKLVEVIKLEYGKPLADFKRKSDGMYPVYGANGVKDRTNEFYSNKKSIIVGRKGSAGEITLTEEKFWPLDVTYFVTFDNKNNDLFFIYYLLNNLDLKKLAKGVKPGINRNDVYSIGISIPPLTEQQRIVKHLDHLSEQTKKLEAIYQKKLANLEELKKSILQKAFNGELTESTSEIEARMHA